MKRNTTSIHATNIFFLGHRIKSHSHRVYHGQKTSEMNRNCLPTNQRKEGLYFAFIFYSVFRKWCLDYTVGVCNHILKYADIHSTRDGHPICQRWVDISFVTVILPLSDTIILLGWSILRISFRILKIRTTLSANNCHNNKISQALKNERNSICTWCDVFKLLMTPE